MVATSSSLGVQIAPIHFGRRKTYSYTRHHCTLLHLLFLPYCAPSSSDLSIMRSRIIVCSMTNVTSENPTVGRREQLPSHPAREGLQVLENIFTGFMPVRPNRSVLTHAAKFGFNFEPSRLFRMHWPRNPKWIAIPARGLGNFHRGTNTGDQGF